MKCQNELTRILRDAKGHLGLQHIENLLHHPFSIRISDHDTGCQISIWLAADKISPVEVWTGSIWYSSRYEFNDREKILGLHPEVKFCEPALTDFFIAVEEALDAYKENKVSMAKSKQDRELKDKQNAIEYYRTMF